MLKVAFYRARIDGRIWDQAVNWFSGFGGFAHVELVFSDGVSFSSTSMDQPPGPRFKQIDYSAHPKRWELVDLPQVSSEIEDSVRAWATEKVAMNAGYDWGAIWGFVPFVRRFVAPDDDRWICSEIVATALLFAGVLPISSPAMHQISPNRLRKLLS